MNLDLKIDESQPARLLESARQSGLCIFGAGNFARSLRSALLQRGVNVHAFVVSSAPNELTVDGTKIVGVGNASAALKSLPMWLGVFNGLRESDYGIIIAACKSSGFDNVFAPQAYFESVSDLLGWRYWLTDRRNYSAYEGKIRMAMELMDDDESRRQLAETISFRLGQGVEMSPQPVADPQYFPADVLKRARLPDSVSILDAGAFDGDTIALAQAHLSLGAAYAFEPDLGNFAKLVANVSEMAIPVTCFPCGVSDQTRLVGFTSGQGTASSVAASGDQFVQVVRLDDCLNRQPVDFIKFDIEGHELDGLKGAAKIIQNRHPMLAIAAYHRWDDIWAIPQFLHQLGTQYRFAYRTHEYNTYESVIYAY